MLPINGLKGISKWENLLIRSFLMTRSNNGSIALQHHLEKRRLIKIIAGITNFESSSVERIAKAAARGGADLIDVACDPQLVKLAAAVSGLPICVSAIDPQLFPEAVAAGAEMVEIGNFDAFYAQGRIFEPAEVLSLTKETRNLLPQTFLSVTVPHILPLDQQAQLALDLVALDVDMIQTEGGTSANPLSPGLLGLIEKAAPTLAATSTISKAFLKESINVPVLCASGLSSITVPMAIASGASGVGIGSAVNRLTDYLSMVAVVREIKETLVSSKIPAID